MIHRDKAVVVSEMGDEDQDKQRGLMKELIKLMEIQLMKADGPSSSPVSSKISATEGKCFPAQARNASKITSWMALWHYLRDRGEDMRKWHDQTTPVLRARVRELQSRSRSGVVAPVTTGNKQRGPALRRGGERDNRVYWTVWIRWPGTSEPHKYQALVDSGAQCTLMSSSHEGTESIHICGVSGGSQELTALEAKIRLTGTDWQKHPIVTGPGAPCMLDIDCLRRGHFKDPTGYRWAFGIAAGDTDDMKQPSLLPGLSEDPSVVGLLHVKEQQVPTATKTVHRQQYCTNRDSSLPILKLIR